MSYFARMTVLRFCAKEEGEMSRAIFLIIIFCLIISGNLAAQQQNEKKEKVKQEKVVEPEKAEQQKTVEKKKNEEDNKPIKLQKAEETKTVYQELDLKRRKPVEFSNFIPKYSDTQKQYNKTELQKFKKYKHKPYSQQNIHQQIHYVEPIQYHYTISPRYIYRGIWIRYSFFHDDGFFFYDGYPYFVYNNHLHRYSSVDTGSYDLVDSITDKVYATFYGVSLKQSYDRCADLRDRLNNEEGFYRYFCSERFIYDPDYNYDWDPEDYPDWYWY